MAALAGEPEQEPDAHLTSAAEFLRSKGLDNVSRRVSFGMQAAKLRKEAWKRTNPGRPLTEYEHGTVREHDGAQWLYPKAYGPEELPMLEEALQLCLAREMRVR